MVFHRESPRACPVDDAVVLAASVRREAEIVGVFHNAPLDSVARVADIVGLTAVQLHGEEGPAYCNEVARRTGCAIIKSARVSSPGDILALRAFRTDFHLLDASAKSAPGGTGETFPWEYTTSHNRKVAMILAGGLNPDNVIEAITVTSPFAVDVASGVEISPGIKDHSLMDRFAAAVRSTDPVVAEPEPIEGEAA
jgi:phosphoribosylanthranilate isomerase